jgi:hypothetical protein
MNECPVCGGKLQNKFVNICSCDSLPATIVTNVPALVCEICGEKVLSQSVVDNFQKIRKGIAIRPRYEISKVYDYQQVTKSVQPASNSYPMITPSVAGTAGRGLERIGLSTAST